jgi:uncharacterized protein (TIRG00374 family)
MIESRELPKTRLSFKSIAAYAYSKKRITSLVSVGFGIVLISWLVAELDFSSAIEIVRSVPPEFLAAGILCYGLGFYLRSIRFRLLLPEGTPARQLFPIVLVHYTALNIIPARLGEFSYLYLLKKINNVSTGHSVSNLLIARVFDHMAISTVFLISSVVLNFSSQWLRTLRLVAGGFLISTFVLLILAIAYKERCIQGLKSVLRALKWDALPASQKVLRELEDIVSAFNTIKIRHKALQIYGISLMIWLSIFGLNYFSLNAFQMKLSYLEIIFSSTCIILLKLLPVQLLSGFGVHEVTRVMIALAFGVPKSVAITASFGSHIVATIYLVGFGLYGLARLQPYLNRTPSGQPSQENHERS